MMSKEENSMMILIKYLALKLGELVPVSDLTEEAKKLGYVEHEIKRYITQLKKQGKIFEPEDGFLREI